MRLLLALLLLAPASVFGQPAEDPDRPVGLGFFFVTDADGRTIVTGVAEDGAAAAAGLQPGDILLSVDGEVVPLYEGIFDLLTVARETPPVPIEVERDGAAVALSLGVAPYYAPDLVRAAHLFLCQSGDCQNGEGVWQHPNGRHYVGRFENGVRRGYGIYTWPDTSYYEGAHADDMLNGYGAYTWPSGWSWRGHWTDDEGTEGAYYTPEGTFHEEGTFDHLYFFDRPDLLEQDESESDGE